MVNIFQTMLTIIWKSKFGSVNKVDSVISWIILAYLPENVMPPPPPTQSLGAHLHVLLNA